MPEFALLLNIEPEEWRDDQQTQRRDDGQEEKDVEEYLIDLRGHGAPIIGDLLIVFEFLLFTQQAVQRFLNFVLHRADGARARERSILHADLFARDAR